jgi:tRNA-dihydrouridine synthase
VSKADEQCPNRRYPKNPSLSFGITALSLHLALIAEHQPDTPPSQIKNHAGRYFKGVPGGAEIRRQIFNQTSYAALEKLIASLANPAPLE